MLVKAVEDLEQEATERVRLLEQKLNKTATAEMEVNAVITALLAQLWII